MLAPPGNAQVLNESAALIWDELEVERRETEVVARLHEHTGADLETLRADVSSLLTQLRDLRLIHETEADPSTTDRTAPS